ncbi:GAF domain-containing protein [Sporosarcina sp. CAU 1771]
MGAQKTFNYQQEIDQIKHLFDFDFVALALVQQSEQRFAIKWECVSGNRSTRYKRIRLQSGKGIAGLVFKTGKPILAEDVNTTFGLSDLYNYPIIVAEGLESFGAIPLYKYNRVQGVLLVAFRTKDKMTTDLFEALKLEIGPSFGPFYNKEMVKR